MKTSATLPTVKTEAAALIQQRLERYLGELKALHSRSMSRGWEGETALVAEEMERVRCGQAEGAELSSFAELARMQWMVRRDLALLVPYVSEAKNAAPARTSFLSRGLRVKSSAQASAQPTLPSAA